MTDLHDEVVPPAGAPLPDPADFQLVVPSPGVPRERYAARASRASDWSFRNSNCSTT